MSRRVLLVGATGAFGERLARLLARTEGVELVLAGRRTGPLEALAAELGARAEAFDRERPEALAKIAPWAVVDASGPFQGAGFDFARAVVEARAHYVDIADARHFVAAFSSELDEAARAASVLAATGASSTPALSNAVLDALTCGWRQVDTVSVAISPGARAPRGLSVVRAILSSVGRPVRVFEDGAWQVRPGWSGPRRLYFPGLGWRWASLCETPDLDILPARFGVRREARFLAGLELAPLHLGLWLMSWPVRLGLARNLTPLARPLRAAAGVAAAWGSDRGGMRVEAVGQGPDGRPRHARWSLAAEANAGPTVPVAAAAAVLRGLAEGRITQRGARTSVGMVSLDEILAELRGLPISTTFLSITTDERALFPRVLGDRFAALPGPVRRVHSTSGSFSGRARARGARSLPVRLLRSLLGLPQPGRYPQLTVAIERTLRGERWTRVFGVTQFDSDLSATQEPGLFAERFGLTSFIFEAEPRANGFRWRFVGWRMGPVPLPVALAPSIRARAFAADGSYRFSVAAAHPCLGILFAYAGRLRVQASAPVT